MRRRAFLKGIGGAAVATTIPVTVFAGLGKTAPVIQRTKLTGLNEIVAQTLRSRSVEIARNISSHNSLINFLNEKHPPTYRSKK